MNTSKNVGELSFIVISVDNSHLAGGKQRGRLASNNLCEVIKISINKITSDVTRNFWLQLSNYIFRKVFCLCFSFIISPCLDSEFQMVEVISQGCRDSWGPCGGSLVPGGSKESRGPRGSGVLGLGPIFLPCQYK